MRATAGFRRGVFRSAILVVKSRVFYFMLVTLVAPLSVGLVLLIVEHRLDPVNGVPREGPPGGMERSHGSPPSANDSEAFDGFEGQALDTTLWRSDGRNPQLIYTSDHQLHLDANPQSAPTTVETLENGVGTEIVWRSPRPIRKVSFTMRIISTAASDGAAYAVVTDMLGREQRVWMGPDGVGRPACGYWICLNNSCNTGVYGDFLHPEGGLLSAGRSYDVVIEQTPAGIQFMVADRPPQTVPVAGPIAQFKFFVYSNPGGAFHVVADDVRIAYA